MRRLSATRIRSSAETLHNKVVFRLARGIRETGAAVLRFNFRGVGQSGGEHDNGKGEQDDVRAAVAYMRDRYPGLPLQLAGFSFGSSMSLKVACGDPGIERVIGCGVPVDRASFGFLKACACPRYFIHSTNDEYGSKARMQEVYESMPAPKQLEWVEAEDHFFKGSLDAFEEAVKAAAVYPF